MYFVNINFRLKMVGMVPDLVVGVAQASQSAPVLFYF